MKLWRFVLHGAGLLCLFTVHTYAIEPVARVALPVLSQQRQREFDDMAFVTNTWISVNGDASDANSWSGGIPAANDVCVFDGSSQQAVTSGLDLTAGAFEQLLVKPSYYGAMGFAGSPLRIDIGDGELVYRGAGRAFINTRTGTTPLVIVDIDRSLNGGYGLTLGGMGIVTAGVVSNIYVKRGRCRMLGDVSLVQKAYILGSGAELRREADLGGGESNPDHIILTAGYMWNGQAVPANGVLIVSGGGKLTQVGAIPASGDVIILGNGKFEYLPIAAPGTSPEINVLSGVYDQTDERYDNVWGTTLIGPDGQVIGGTLRGTGLWPPSLDLTEEYPGDQS